ncbi:MAG: hypothetical protein RLZZ450_4918 [Pseudomonadota bacterium]|jgi:hypothetical protein
MKLTFQQDDDLQPKPDARSDRRSGFSRARAQLSQAVGGVLVSSLGALSGRRAQSAVPTSTPAAAMHGLRLREIIERDRALIASQPPPAPVEAAPPSAEQDDWMELRAAQEIAEQETSAIRERSDESRASTLETYFEESVEPDEWMAHEARAIEVLAPRGDAIALAIAETIAEDDDDIDDVDDDEDEDDEDDEDTREMVPVQLEPLVASTATPATSPKPVAMPSSTAATVVMPKPMQVALCKEPIRTRTMAKLLATQGHRERALSIYDHLLQKAVGDDSLRAEADALRAGAD